MDVDVFSPALPVPPTTTELQRHSHIITRDLISTISSEEQSGELSLGVF